MKFTIELEHPELDRVRFAADEVQRSDDTVERVWSGNINIFTKTHIEIGFWPWKIEPLLRINGHLVDYGLAGVDQFDHALSFSLGRDFFDAYGRSLVAGRIYSQFKDGVVDDKIYDAVIGYGRRHTELIDSIKRIVDL